MDFSLEPRASKPWAAIVRLTPAMLACLEAQPGRASVTISSTGDATLRVAENAFAFASIAEEVPGDLVRGASLDDASSASAPSDARRALRVAGSLRCRLQPKRALTGADGLAARVKRRVAEEGGGRRSRAAVVVEDDARMIRDRADPLGEVGASDPGRATARTTRAARDRMAARLASLAASAARQASGRAANQLRAATLVLLAERPLTFAALRAALTAGLTAANLPPPDRGAVEATVKKVAAIRAPGRYFLREPVRAEARELTRLADRDARDGDALLAAVRTPPLSAPPLPERPTKPIDETVAAGLTDEEDSPTPPREEEDAATEEANEDDDDGFDAPAPRAEGDVSDAWRVFLAPARLGREMCRDATCEASARRRAAEFRSRYATYAAATDALANNAAEYSALAEATAEARRRRELEESSRRGSSGAPSIGSSRASRRHAALARKMEAFRAARGERYAEMAEVAAYLERELAAVKRAVRDFAETRRGGAGREGGEDRGGKRPRAGGGGGGVTCGGANAPRRRAASGRRAREPAGRRDVLYTTRRPAVFVILPQLVRRVHAVARKSHVGRNLTDERRADVPSPGATPRAEAT
jgi:hypothetical protein